MATTAQLQIDWSRFRKTSFASHAPRPNASSSSVNPQFDNVLLEVIDTAYSQVLPQSYKLSQLTSRATLNHDNRCSNIKNWLHHNLHIDENNIDIGKGIKPKEVGLYQLFRSRVKMPDVAVYNHHSDQKQILVQVEVISDNNRDKTIRKLAYGLIDQLRWQKNRDKLISFCTGFYFPLEGDNEYVIELKCCWDDYQFKYIATKMYIDINYVVRRFRSVMQAEKAKVHHISGLEDACLTLPLSPSYIRHTFGIDAFQVCSGQSVVVINPHEKKVYKCPLMLDAKNALDVMHGQVAQNVVFPIGREMKQETFYFVFPLYTLPKTLAEIKHNIVPFVEGVVTALLELHQMGRAHLDVRRENVCYDDLGQVKLIDLDRSCSISKEPSNLCQKYGYGVMYNCPIPSGFSTVENVDWRQLGIMICHTLNDVGEKMYHDTEPTANHRFLEELCNNGKDLYFISEVYINLYFLLLQVYTTAPCIMTGTLNRKQHDWNSQPWCW